MRAQHGLDLSTVHEVPDTHYKRGCMQRNAVLREARSRLRACSRQPAACPRTAAPRLSPLRPREVEARGAQPPAVCLCGTLAPPLPRLASPRTRRAVTCATCIVLTVCCIIAVVYTMEDKEPARR